MDIISVLHFAQSGKSLEQNVRDFLSVVKTHREKVAEPQFESSSNSKTQAFFHFTMWLLKNIRN